MPGSARRAGRGNVDHPAAIGEPRQHRAGDEEGDPDVEVEGPVEQRDVGVLDQAVLTAAEIVDEDVDAAARADHPIELGEHRVDPVGRRDLRPDREGLTAAGLDRGDGGIGGFGIEQPYPRPSRRQPLGDSPAHAAPAARHQGNLPLQIAFHPLRLLFVSGLGI